jgi:hypothetical protein
MTAIRGLWISIKKPWRPVHGFGIILFCMIMMNGCGLPPESEWPVLTLYIDPACRDFLKEPDLDLFTHRLGYHVEVVEIPDVSLLETLQEIPGAGIVMVTHDATWNELIRLDILGDEKSRFVFRRERLLHHSGVDVPYAADRHSPLGRLTLEARHRNRKQVEVDRDVREIHPRELHGIFNNAADVLPAGYYAESWLDNNTRNPDDFELLDPWPRVSMECMGAVLAATGQLAATDALWNYLERTMRSLPYGFIPVEGPTPSREYWLRGAIL